jgi:hypothetical protein
VAVAVAVSTIAQYRLITLARLGVVGLSLFDTLLTWLQLHQQQEILKRILPVIGACTDGFRLEQSHSEVLWHKVYLISNKLTKLSNKALGPI